MRSLIVVAALAGTAGAGPIARIGGVGGYDTSAPGHREDGLALGAGYETGPFTAELDYSYLQYDGSDGTGGGANRLGVLLQARLLTMKCHPGATCPHFDLDVGGGRRWVEWVPAGDLLTHYTQPTIDRQGRELSVGVSATFGLHFALHYVVFVPDAGPEISCRGGCTMQTVGDDKALLLEASFVVGG